MQFPLSWLLEYVDPQKTGAELADLLTMAGLEVEQIQTLSTTFQDIYVAKVLEVSQHPNADRLKLCTVDIGRAQPLQIVCGAPNVRPGIKVPCAAVGASLYNASTQKTLIIRESAIRGVVSQGMLCSASELGISTDSAGLLILDDSAPIGMELGKAITLNDTLYTIKLTPNRSDCLSILGIAREVAAISGTLLKLTPKPTPINTHTDAINVRIDAKEACGRFASRLIKGIDSQAPTPLWMKLRLERSGLRSISALVDITNYVMLEMGQPMHAFDADKIKGALNVRMAKAGEKLLLLNGETVILSADNTVISDDTGVISLAGIMGGESTKVNETTTTNVLFEAAFWFPQALAGCARKLALKSDANYRFERGVDFSICIDAVDYAAWLARQICGGEIGDLVDVVSELPQRSPITMRFARAEKVIGIPVDPAQCERYFSALGFKPKRNDETISIEVPAHRFDLSIEEDLIEEYVRLAGFNALPLRPPLQAITPSVYPEFTRSSWSVQQALIALGYHETINFSFVPRSWEKNYCANEQLITLDNPISLENDVMRSSLLGSLMHALQYNVARKTLHCKLFEIGKTYHVDKNIEADIHHIARIAQSWKVAGIAHGYAQQMQWGQPSKQVDFFDIKGDLEQFLGKSLRTQELLTPHPALHPHRSATLYYKEACIGIIGHLHPQWIDQLDLAFDCIVFEFDLDKVRSIIPPAATLPPRQQSMQRDLSLFIEANLNYQNIESNLLAIAERLTQNQNFKLQTSFPFDRFTNNDGQTSLALRLIFSSDTPVADATIDGMVEKLSQMLMQQLPVTLRAN